MSIESAWQTEVSYWINILSNFEILTVPTLPNLHDCIVKCNYMCYFCLSIFANLWQQSSCLLFPAHVLHSTEFSCLFMHKLQICDSKAIVFSFSVPVRWIQQCIMLCTFPYVCAPCLGDSSEESAYRLQGKHTTPKIVKNTNANILCSLYQSNSMDVIFAHGDDMGTKTLLIN